MTYTRSRTGTASCVALFTASLDNSLSSLLRIRDELLMDTIKTSSLWGQNVLCNMNAYKNDLFLLKIKSF